MSESREEKASSFPVMFVSFANKTDKAMMAQYRLNDSRWVDFNAGAPVPPMTTVCEGWHPFTDDGPTGVVRVAVRADGLAICEDSTQGPVQGATAKCATSPVISLELWTAREANTIACDSEST